MQWAAAALGESPRYRNPLGVRAGCADRHIPCEDQPATPFQYVFGTLWTKGLDGARDVVAKLRGVISEEAKREAEKPRLTTEVRTWFKETHSATCQGCDKLNEIEKTGPSAFMAMEVHAGLIESSTVDGLECHSGIACVYSSAAK